MCIGGHQSKLLDEADENDSEGCEHVAATPLFFVPAVREDSPGYEAGIYSPTVLRSGKIERPE